MYVVPRERTTVRRNFIMVNSKKRGTVEKIVLTGVLTALVVVLQMLGSFIRFGPFSISFVLIPIVIGVATCGMWSGAWLGYVFGLVVLFSGDASAFMAVNIPGTIVTVLVKGTACGLVAGLVYKPLAALCGSLAERIKNKNPTGFRNFLAGVVKYLPVVAAAIVCPVVNTGLFLIGCVLFFLDTVREWGYASGFGGTAQYMFLGLVGGNFLFELGFNLFLSPIIVRLLCIRKKL